MTKSHRGYDSIPVSHVSFSLRESPQTAKYDQAPPRQCHSSKRALLLPADLVEHSALCGKSRPAWFSHETVTLFSTHLRHEIVDLSQGPNRVYLYHRDLLPYVCSDLLCWSLSEPGAPESTWRNVGRLSPFSWRSGSLYSSLYSILIREISKLFLAP